MSDEVVLQVHVERDQDQDRGQEDDPYPRHVANDHID